MILLKQMLVLFLLMLIGYLCRKTGLLNAEASKKLSGLVVNVANPALILSSGINPEDPLSGMQLLSVLGLSLLIYAALIAVSFVFPVLIRAPKKDRNIYRLLMIFSNIGFMGFPLISSVYGSKALVMATIFLVPYNVLIYTLGICLLDPGKKLSVKETLKKIFNVGVIACILSMVLYVTRVPVPSVIEDTVDYLSDLIVPLGMLIIGDSMTTIRLKELITDWRIFVFSAVNLLVVPIAGILLLKLCGIQGDLLGVCMIMLATPVGSMTVMLAQQYDSNCELAAKGIGLTTILSVATIPIVSLLV